MKDSLIIVGCGGHARSMIDIVESSLHWQVLGLVGLQDQVGMEVCGYPVIGSDEDLPLLRNRCANALLGVGQVGLPYHRKRLASTLEQLEFVMPAVTSRYAYVSSHAHLGKATSVGHGVIVNASANIGNYCILNTNALLEHDTLIGNFCHISTGVLVNGGVQIGDDSFIGSGVMIREGLKFPSRTVISAGKRVMGWPIREDIQ